MRKLFVIIVLAVCARASYAQDRFLDYFLQRADTSAVSFAFGSRSLDAAGNVLSEQTGSGTAQKGAFRLDEGAISLYSDGVKRWTLDSSSKEAVSQRIPKGAAPDLLTDPVQFLLDVRAGLKEEFAGTARFRGRPAHAIFFEPGNLPGLGAGARVKLYMREGVLFAAVTEDSKGNVVEVSFRQMKLSPRLPSSEFVPDLKSLGNGWVVTEL